VGAAAHCFPPVRDAAGRQALWNRVVGGSVDTIASDHSPCPPALKAADPPWAGVDGVGLALPVLLTSGRLSPARIAELTTSAARLLRLPRKGAIAPGYDADLALVDPAATWTPGPATLWSRHRCSPYAGTAVTGQVVMTLLRGREVFSLAHGPSEPGGAELIRPKR
jgi:allantoinase